MTTPHRPRYEELAAVVAVKAGHVIVEITHGLDASRIFSAMVLPGYLAYLTWRLATGKDVLRSWGLRTDNFWTALRAQLLFFAPAAAVLVAVGLIGGKVPMPATFWLVCGLYPIFGVAQQFVLQNFIASNLRGLIRQDVLCASAAALLFGLAHLPRLRLSVAAMVGGFFLTLIHQRHPNIWAVGMMHGLLASMTFYMILEEDPGARILQLISGVLGLGA